MAVTVGGTSITFNDNTTQSQKPMKLLAEVVNSSTASHTFSTGLSNCSQIIVVWDANQTSGPSGTSFTISESTTGMSFSTRESHSLIVSNTSVTPAVNQVTQAASTTNFLSGFSGGATFNKGYVVLTRVRKTTSSLGQLWNMSISGGSTTSNFLGNLKIGTNSASPSLVFGIGSISINFGLSNGINASIYGVE